MIKIKPEFLLSMKRFEDEILPSCLKILTSLTGEIKKKDVISEDTY